jgi:hypothetical protein
VEKRLRSPVGRPDVPSSIPKLKELKYDGNITVALYIAKKDYDEYVVESILDHKFDTSPD